MSTPSKNLGILAKTLILVSALVCVLTLSFIAVSHRLVTSKFLQLETGEAYLNLERVVNDLNTSRRRLETLVGDWAPWDDVYTFVRDLNHDFIEKNLSEESFRTLGINFMLFFDNSNTLVFSRFFNLEKSQQSAPDTSVIFALKAVPSFFQFATPQTKQSGLISSKTTPVLVAAAPIVTSTYGGPIRGTLIFGRYLDQSTLHQISIQNRLEVKTLPADHENQALFSAQQKHLFSIAAVPLPVAFDVAQPQTMRAYAQLTDLRGHPVVILSVTLERTLYQHGRAMWADHVLSLVGLGTVFILAMMFLLNRFILQPLTRLSGEVDHIGQAGDHAVRVTVRNRDEIGVLATAINAMLDSLQRLHLLQQKNEHHLKQIIDSINCGIMLVDAQSRQILSINRAGAAMAGRQPEDMVGQTCHQFICP